MTTWGGAERSIPEKAQNSFGQFAGRDIMWDSSIESGFAVFHGSAEPIVQRRARDYEGAKRAGLKSLLIDREGNAPENVESIRTLAEVLLYF